MARKAVRFEPLDLRRPQGWQGWVDKAGSTRTAARLSSRIDLSRTVVPPNHDPKPEKVWARPVQMGWTGSWVKFDAGFVVTVFCIQSRISHCILYPISSRRRSGHPRFRTRASRSWRLGLTLAGFLVAHLSAGRQQMGEAIQALCFMAGANSIFYGDKLLTTGNPEAARDRALLDKLGIQPE